MTERIGGAAAAITRVPPIMIRRHSLGPRLLAWSKFVMKGKNGICKHVIWLAESKFLVAFRARRTGTEIMNDCSRRTASTTFADLFDSTSNYHRGITSFSRLTFVQPGMPGSLVVVSSV